VSVQTYGYEAHFKWKWHKSFDPWAIQDKETVIANLIADMKTAFMAQFAETLTKEGHWYRLDDVSTNITKYDASWGLPLPLPPLNVDVEGESTVFFQSDIKDASAHNSPQLWQEVQNAIWSIIHYITTHPYIGVILLAAGYLTILTIWLINTLTGAINDLAKNPFSFALTLGILAVVGLGIYALFFTKSGRKAGTKTYQLGRRAYRKVKRRS
jgi:hypothetical protein